MARRLTRKRRGGARLGRGVSGIVYSPPLRCTDGSQAEYSGKGYVSKVVPGDLLASQLVKSDEIKTLDPDGLYTIVPLHYCPFAADQTNANFRRNRNDPTNVYNNVSSNNTRRGKKKNYTHMIIYRNGGQNLSNVLKSSKNFPKVFAALKEFIPHLVEFNRHYTHFDLHLENLVFDGARIRMIDFEKTEDSRPELGTVDICNFLPVIYRRLNNYSLTENTCDTTYNAWLSKYRYLEDYEVCRSKTVDELVECINNLPVSTPKSSGCSIMG